MAKRTRPSKARVVGLACVVAISCAAGGYYLKKGDGKIKANKVALVRPAKSMPAAPPATTSALARKAEPITASHAVKAADKAGLKRLDPAASGPKPAGAPLAKAQEPSPLGTSLVGEDFQSGGQWPEDPNEMTLAVAFENHARKPIRAFEGVLQLIDREDKEIYSSTISVSARIPKGASLRWSEHLDASKLDEKRKRLFGEEKTSIKAVFRARKIFFIDGTVEKYELRG